MTFSDANLSNLSADDRHGIEQVVDFLENSKNILFITGAGLSADSGLPTYRGVNGLYEDKNPEEGLPIEELLSGEMIQYRPDVTWKYLLQIEQACRGARLNRGHEVIALMESHFDRVWVITQNVDGFHRQAGSRNVIDLHGNLHQICCMGCDYERSVEDYSDFVSIPPHCSKCGGILRPKVVLFNESLPQWQMYQYTVEMQRGFDVVFSIGTSNIFHYISAPVKALSQQGKPVVEINPVDTAVTEFATVKLRGSAALMLDRIWQGYQGKLS